MMMISAAIMEVFKEGIIPAYLIVLAPNIFFTLLCFYASSKVQLNVASMLTAIYAFIMMAVLVNIVIQAVRTSLFNPGVVIITAMIILFVFTAMLHPQEKMCLLPGVLYFLCIPSGYLLLVIYSLCNMHVVSWGTREVKEKLTKKQQELAKKEEEMKIKKKKDVSFFSKLFQFPAFAEFSEMFKASQMKKENEVLKALATINNNISKLLSEKQIEAEQILVSSTSQKEVDNPEKKNTVAFEDDYNDDVAEKDVQAEPLIPAWANGLGKGIIVDLNNEEKKFWIGVIKKYLYPLNSNKEEEKKAQEDLIVLRTNMCFAMIMINLLWMGINFMFQLSEPSQIQIGGVDVDLFRFVFLLFFTLMFIIQFFGMLMHRWGTFLHIISYTTIQNPFRKKQHQDKTLNKECCREIIRKLRYEPVPDYDERIEINKFQKEFEEKVERHLQKTAIIRDDRYVERNIQQKKIGCVLRKSQKHQNTNIGLTIYRKATGPARKYESRYDRKEQPVIVGSKRREQRKNLQLVSRKNLRNDLNRLIRQTTIRQPVSNKADYYLHAVYKSYTMVIQ